jgi:S-adenosylmethionine hydrolase
MSVIITLTSDWNKNDYYLGIVKAKILSEILDATLIDVSHSIMPFNITHTGFLLKNIYKNYPVNTINIICVDTVVAVQENYFAVKANDRYFISANNGVFGLILDNADIQAVYEFPQNKTDINFPEKDIFPLIINSIFHGNISDYAASPAKLKLMPPHQPTKMLNMITGNVIYIDSYGNAITNISKELFTLHVSYAFEIIIGSPTTKITKISPCYTDVDYGELVALFNSLNLLEIAKRNDNFCKVYAVDEFTPIMIRFGKSLF